MRKISAIVCLILWIFVGVMGTIRPVSHTTFYCCIGCLCIKYIEDILRK